jgi:hypothetical protein
MGPDELRPFNSYFLPLGSETQVMVVLFLMKSQIDSRARFLTSSGYKEKMNTDSDV